MDVVRPVHVLGTGPDGRQIEVHGGPLLPGGLHRAGIEFVRVNDAGAVETPFGFGRVRHGCGAGVCREPVGLRMIRLQRWESGP